MTVLRYLLPALLLSPACWAEDNPPSVPQWSTVVGEQDASLSLGAGGDDFSQLSFVCSTEHPEIVIFLHQDPPKASAAHDYTATLKVGSRQLNLTGPGRIEENYGSLEVELRSGSESVRALLRAGDSLAVTLLGATQNYSLKNAKAPIDALLSGCATLQGTP